MLQTEGVGESLDLSSFHRDAFRLFLLYCSQKSSVDAVDADKVNTEFSEGLEEVEESVEENDWFMEAEEDTVEAAEDLEEAEESVEKND